MFWEPAPLSRVPIALPDRPSHAVVVKAEVELLLQKQAIEIVEDPTTPGFYSRLFVVPKQNAK